MVPARLTIHAVIAHDLELLPDEAGQRRKVVFWLSFTRARFISRSLSGVEVGVIRYAKHPN
jgi:hypothetical protein